MPVRDPGKAKKRGWRQIAGDTLRTRGWTHWVNQSINRRGKAPPPSIRLKLWEAGVASVTMALAMSIHCVLVQ